MGEKKSRNAGGSEAPNHQCLRCGSKCCDYFALPIDEPEDRKDFDDIRWYLLHEGVSVFVEDGNWYIQIDNRCKALTTEGLCEIYEDRPRICRKYKDDVCEFAVPDGEYELLLQTTEECMAYAEKVLGKKAKKAKKNRKKK
ncbi:MAG: YkgJ family cysteine cluster protein [Phycisphaerae bacterium]|nr:YkgJ family cysteine cluster protein [Phycisphaerae bacterium]